MLQIDAVKLNLFYINKSNAKVRHIDLITILY